MLIEIYIEALLVDKDLADQIWERWNAGAITDEVAVWIWITVVRKISQSVWLSDQPLLL